MAVYVNTNVSSLNGQRYLNNVQSSLNTTYQRLSSGYRINSAKDDAAGLQIADRLTSQINGLNQGNRNANDGIALAQTIEGGLDEIISLLQRGRTLAVQSANGTLGSEDRKAISDEIYSIQEEIHRIGEQTTFGGKHILVGFNAGDSIYSGQSEHLTDAAGNQVTDGGKLIFHVGANTDDRIETEVPAFTWSAIVNQALDTTGNSVLYQQPGVFVEILTQDDANQAINEFDTLIAYVDHHRANLGAIQNRLESTIRNQANVSANSADARSRIQDADFAEESANLSQQSIIQQAATSMLMQANTRPQLALSMLG
ncbi:MAG: flagellin [Anaerobiospirillum sp.]|nr:flagellin [Anaerobiospirillum sp.]